MGKSRGEKDRGGKNTDSVFGGGELTVFEVAFDLASNDSQRSGPKSHLWEAFGCEVLDCFQTRSQEFSTRLVHRHVSVRHGQDSVVF